MRKKLKKYREDIIIVISILTVLFLLLLHHLFGDDVTDFFLHGKSVQVERLNGDSNPCKSEDEYVYPIGKWIYRYSFQDGETEKKLPFEGANGYIVYLAAWNGQAYCVCIGSTGSELWKFHYGTEEDERLLSGEEMALLYDGDDGEEINRVGIKIYNNVLLLKIEGEKGERIYLCPAGKGHKEDYIEADSLFSGEGMDKGIFTPFRKLLFSGGELEEAAYEGMVLKRQYDTETESYRIVQIRDEESGRNIFPGSRCAFTVGGKNVEISSQKGELRTYSVDGEKSEHHIDCLEAEQFRHSKIYADRLVVEDEEVIGMVTVPKSFQYSDVNPQRSDFRYEVLFKLNPETGENSIIYRTRNNWTRIIGYKDGEVYLMKNYKIYKEPIDGGKRKYLFSLPKYHDYIIDWQGPYLVVRCDDARKKYYFIKTKSHYEVAAHYKVE